MTAVLVLSGSENVLVFGGRTPSCLALGDCYLLNLETRMWRKVTTSKKLFSSFGVRLTKKGSCAKRVWKIALGVFIYHVQKSFRKIWLGSKWNTIF